MAFESIEAGIDVAWQGGDESAICVRRGPRVLELWAKPYIDLVPLFGKAKDVIARHNVGVCRVDVVGYGASLYQLLRDARLVKCNVVPVNVGMPSRRPERFANLRAELWFVLRERIRAGQCWLPDDPVLLRQLAEQPPLELRADGRLKMPGKEELKDSPDRAEALMLAFAEGLGGAKGGTLEGVGGGLRWGAFAEAGGWVAENL